MKRTVNFEVSFFSLGKKRTSLVHPQEKKHVARFLGKKFVIVCCPLAWRKASYRRLPCSTYTSQSETVVSLCESNLLALREDNMTLP